MTQKFAASICAARDVSSDAKQRIEVEHKVLVIAVDSLEAAKEVARRRALYDWPRRERFEGHDALVMPVER